MTELSDTQPTTSSQDSTSSSDVTTINAWGRLYPVSLSSRTPIDLAKNAITVGRSPDCDIVLTQLDMNGKSYFQTSKTHFRIERHMFNDQCNVVQIIDTSTNGTFVNDKKIGKQNKRIICNNDNIAVANTNNKMFLYTDLTMGDDEVPEVVKRKYVVSKLLGKGGFGEVRLVFQKDTLMQYAMKIITLDPDPEDNLRIFNELHVLFKTKHKNIITMHDMIKTDSQMFLVLELMMGGDLAQKIFKLRRIPETQTKHIFYQLLRGVQHLHSNNIVHRDLKPANILLSSDEEYPVVKITDFGLSKFISRSYTILNTVCGTTHYTAPEVLFGDEHTFYSSNIDVWSLGVMLFLCLSGELPFSKKRSDMPLDEQIKKASYKLNNEAWKNISPNAINIIKKTLIVNGGNRISVNDFLSEPWIKEDRLLKNRTVSTDKHLKENTSSSMTEHLLVKRFCSNDRGHNN